VDSVYRMWFPSIDNNAYLISRPEPTLIDCGPPNRVPGLQAALRRAGIAAADVRHVAITHHHTDHTGNLASVVLATGATVYGRAGDAGIVRTGAERPRGTAHGLVGRVMLSLAKGASRADPAPVHVEVEDGQELPAAGGLRCVFTPGHTGGHVSFLWPGSGGILFVGDAAANLLRRLDIAPLNEDAVAARASFERLARLEFSVACFGHGSPIRKRAAERFRRRLERAAG
jgi:glyoxylase-like metal-dependent hydrolase (beta-lactamase superfamily II)